MNLQEFLKNAFYTELPLRATAFGHLEVSATLNQIPLLLLIDTGAASTVLDISFVNENGFHLIDTAIKGGGVGTTDLTIHQLHVVELNLAGFVMHDITIYAADLQHVKQSLMERGETAIPSGVIGADILSSHKAIIDYENLKLYLRTDAI